MVTLRQLRYFAALAEERNFGRAADRVHVSQPALSMQIRELEDSLGLLLVERGPREARLTAAGREVARRTQRILAEVVELESAARLNALSGQVNLGVIPTIAPYLLPEVLPQLRANDITRDLRLQEATTDVLLGALERGQLDAIVIASAVQRPDLVTLPLFRDRFLLAGRHDRLARLSVDELRPESLNPDQLLLLTEGHCLADQALEVCGLNRRRTQLDLGATSLTTLCGLAGQGLGMTFLPEIAVAKERGATPHLAMRRFGTPEPDRQIVLVRRRASETGPWFDGLATALQVAGARLIEQARSIM